MCAGGELEHAQVGSPYKRRFIWKPGRRSKWIPLRAGWWQGVYEAAGLGRWRRQTSVTDAVLQEPGERCLQPRQAKARV